MTAETPAGRPNDEPEADLPNVPLLDDAIEFAALETKPTWRGWIHAGTFPLAIVLGVVLIVAAEGAAAKISSSVFVASSLLLFGNSALYHRIDWKPKTKAIFKRIDHANIFLLIAGSYTPITVLALPHDKSVLLLWLVWAGAGLGILFRVFWIGAPRWLYVPLYLLLGYASLIFIVDFFDDDADPGRRAVLHRGRRHLRAEEAQPVSGQVRVPRDLPHAHAAGVSLPLGGHLHRGDQPAGVLARWSYGNRASDFATPAPTESAKEGVARWVSARSRAAAARPRPTGVCTARAAR
jgi:hemolysin III